MTATDGVAAPRSSSAAPAARAGLALAGAVLAWWPLLASSGRTGLAGGAERWLFDAGSTPPALMVALSAWLLVRTLWRLEPQLPVAAPRRAAAAAALLGAGAAVHMWSSWVMAPDLLALSLWAGCAGWALRLWGGAGWRPIAWALAPLLFAVEMPGPLRNAAVHHLQLWTARGASLLLGALGQTVHLSGELLTDADGGRFAVIETCSGLRSLESLTLIGVVMAAAFWRRGWRAWLLVLAAPGIAVALNVLRVALLMALPGAEILSVHLSQGLGVLVLGVALLAILDGAVARGAPPSAPRPSAQRLPRCPLPTGGIALWALALAGAGLLLRGPGPEAWPHLPLSDAWLGDLGRDSGWRIRPLEPDPRLLGSVAVHQATRHRIELPGELPIELSLSLGDLRQRGASPLSPRHALPALGFESERTGELVLEPGGHRATWVEGRIEGRRWLVVHHREGAGGLWLESGRALLAVDRIPGTRRGPVLHLRFATPVSGPQGRREAEARIQAVWRALRPRIIQLRARAQQQLGDPRLTHFPHMSL